MIQSQTKKPYFRNSRNCPLSEPDSPPVDYKNVRLLQKYISERGKMLPSRITSVSAKKTKRTRYCSKKGKVFGVASIPSKIM